MTRAIAEAAEKWRLDNWGDDPFDDYTRDLISEGFAAGAAHGRQAEKAECIKMLEERGREAREDYDEARRLFPDDLAHTQWGIWNVFQQFLHVLRNKDAERGFLVMSDTKPLCPLLFQGKVDPTCIEAKCAWYATNRKQCVLIAVTEAILSSNILGSKTGTKHE